MSLLNNPAFLAYALACVVLSGNLVFLWVYSGVARGGTKTALNEEDAATFGSALVPEDPPKIARILRAHRNAETSIYPFLFLGLVFVLAGGNTLMASIVFGVFTAVRLLHSYAYLKMLQPWRTIAWAAGVLCTVVLLVDVAWLGLRAL